MTYRSITPYNPYDNVYVPPSGFSDEQFRVALEIGALNYANWQRKILAERAAANADAAAFAANELQFCGDNVLQMESRSGMKRRCNLRADSASSLQNLTSSRIMDAAFVTASITINLSFL